MTRGFILLERERERERERELACLRVLLQYEALDTVLYKLPTWDQGWLRPVCASSQSDQTLLFFAYNPIWTYIPKTHTGLQKIQKIPINFMWRGIIMRKYPYIKLWYTFQYPTYMLP